MEVPPSTRSLPRSTPNCRNPAMDMKIGWLHSIAVHPRLQQIRLSPSQVCTGIAKLFAVHVLAKLKAARDIWGTCAPCLHNEVGQLGFPQTRARQSSAQLKLKLLCRRRGRRRSSVNVPSNSIPHCHVEMHRDSFPSWGQVVTGHFNGQQLLDGAIGGNTSLSLSGVLATCAQNSQLLLRCCHVSHGLRHRPSRLCHHLRCMLPRVLCLHRMVPLQEDRTVEPKTYKL